MIIRNINNIKEEPASHEDKKTPGSFKKILFSKADFGKLLAPQMINWARIPEGKSFKLHLHEDMIEIFIIVKGKILIKVGKEEMEVAAGESILIPQATVHKMTNIGRSQVEYYVIGLAGGKNGKTIIRE